jgi:hypothetical protein
MSTAQLDNSNVSKVLGKTVDYPNQYDSSILVREPRQGNREHLDLDDNDLPFCGYDIWNAYEVSCVTQKGFYYPNCSNREYHRSLPERVHTHRRGSYCISSRGCSRIITTCSGLTNTSLSVHLCLFVTGPELAISVSFTSIYSPFPRGKRGPF